MRGEGVRGEGVRGREEMRSHSTHFKQEKPHVHAHVAIHLHVGIMCGGLYCSPLCL